MDSVRDNIIQSRTQEINDEIKLAASRAIAARVPDGHLDCHYIMSGIFDKIIVQSVAKEVRGHAQTGVAAPLKSPPRWAD